MASKSTHFIGSLAKGLKVIEAFGADRPRLAIAEVAALTGLDRAAARRVLLTLHDLGYASYDGKYFELTPRVLRLGVGALASLPLSRLAQPWLDQASERIGQSTSIAILDELEIVYLARAAQRKVMSIGLMPGSRLPAHCTSMGRVLFAALDPEDMAERVARSILTPRTPTSKIAPEEIVAEIERVRAQGYAVVDQEVEMGLRSIAVPIFDSKGRVVAALNTGFAALHEATEQNVKSFLPVLKEVQAGLRRIIA